MTGTFRTGGIIPDAPNSRQEKVQSNQMFMLIQHMLGSGFSAG
jgi:hypothetical protein